MKNPDINADFIWVDGKFVRWEEAAVHPMSRTFLYGFGVYDTIRAYEADGNSCIFRLEDHVDRLIRSAKIAEIELPLPKNELMHVQKEIIRKNQLKNAFCRISIYLGSEDLGVHASGIKSRLIAAAWDWGQYPRKTPSGKGLRLIISSYPHYHANSSMIKSKINGRYVNSILILQEARAQGADDAVFVDQNGYIAEASVANLFMVRKGVVYTPTNKSILEGITRATILEIAPDLGLEVIETDLTRDDLYTADEIFLSGTAIEIKSVGEIDGREINEGKTGTITEKINQALKDIMTDKNPKYSHWISKVY